MILHDMELRWARLDKPVDNFAKDGKQWSLDAITRDKAKSKEMKEAGLNVKVNDDDDGVFYSVKLVKKVRNDDTKPPMVVGRDLMPLEDPSVIGNGSKANVKVDSWNWEFGGKSGKSFGIAAVQITELVEYSGGGGSLLSGFSNLEGGDTFSPVVEDDDDAY